MCNTDVPHDCRRREENRSSSRRQLNGFDSVPYTDGDIRLHDMEVAERTLRLREPDEHTRMMVAEITAIQIWNRRLHGSPVAEVLIQTKAFWNWITYKKVEQRHQGLEVLDEIETTQNGTMGGKYYKGIDAPSVKPPGPYPLPEIGAILREFVAERLSPDEQKILRMWLEGIEDGDMAKELDRSEHAIEVARSRIKKKIRRYLEEPSD